MVIILGHFLKLIKKARNEIHHCAVSLIGIPAEWPFFFEGVKHPATLPAFSICMKGQYY